jgi:hypothetical protein
MRGPIYFMWGTDHADQPVRTGGRAGAGGSRAARWGPVAWRSAGLRDDERRQVANAAGLARLLGPLAMDWRAALRTHELGRRGSIASMFARAAGRVRGTGTRRAALMRS